jgi:hypothetical protein
MNFLILLFGKCYEPNTISKNSNCHLKGKFHNFYNREHVQHVKTHRVQCQKFFKSVVLMEENAPPFVGQDFGGCATIWRGGVTFPFGHDCPSPVLMRRSEFELIWQMSRRVTLLSVLTQSCP